MSKLKAALTSVGLATAAGLVVAYGPSSSDTPSFEAAAGKAPMPAEALEQTHNMCAWGALSILRIQDRASHFGNVALLTVPECGRESDPVEVLGRGNRLITLAPAGATLEATCQGRGWVEIDAIDDRHGNSTYPFNSWPEGYPRVELGPGARIQQEVDGVLETLPQCNVPQSTLHHR
jgi:hypothetical protein